MKNRTIVTTLIIGALLCGCGTTSDVDTGNIDNDDLVREEVSIEQLATRGNGDTLDYESIYLKSDNTNIGDRNYSLLYLNDDDVPEIAVYGNGLQHNDLVEIYTIVEGDVKELGDYGQYGTIQYIQQEGIIYEEYDNAGNFYTNIYKMQDGDITTVNSFQMDYGTDGIFYYIDSQSADESDYREMLAEYDGKLETVGAGK
ncbi:hypothetical protein [Pseudobutyrivibrio sp.]|uniref:hypothetical protein n=1 Tax=Pseudobutyrivibrio sp. TaxID=2014367 RepID=UPI0025F42159|nr:hypothetical protein [Pseudobutyrivibrio sp.]MBR5649487.1 hypothetical protein [Pseudobutyrivibrio sp.]